jgi:hypothetical protein
MQQGPFAPRALPRFSTTTDLAATVSSFLAFPVTPVIRSTWLHRFPGGTRTVSPVAQHVLVTVLPLPPRRSDMTRRSVCAILCCLRPTTEGSAFGLFSVEATRGFTFVAARSLAHHPQDGFVDWLHPLRFLRGCNPSYGALTLTPVGLSPTEHASLRWSHYGPKIRLSPLA